MRTFEELVKENGGCYVEGQASMTMITKARYEQIQLDSFKAGMEYAVQLSDDGIIRTVEETERVILTTAQNLKEIPR